MNSKLKNVPEGWKVQSKPVARSRVKRNKYGNKKIEFQGLKFDSKKELQRYLELKDFESRGLISELRLQVSFELAPGVKFSNEPQKKPALRYFADFTYIMDDALIVEDVKSKITREDKVYRIKKHLMLAVHGIEITEV